MSRYRKIVSGEVELPDVSGTKFVIYPTIETRMELLDHIKNSQIIEELDEKDDKGKIVGTRRFKGKYGSMTDIAKTISKIIYEGCWEHDVNGIRTTKKPDEVDTTEKQITELVLRSDIMKLYVLVLQELDIISKEKSQELLDGTLELEKKS